jgi:hypothetical protein
MVESELTINPIIVIELKRSSITIECAASSNIRVEIEPRSEVIALHNVDRGHLPTLRF